MKNILRFISVLLLTTVIFSFVSCNSKITYIDYYDVPQLIPLTEKSMECKFEPKDKSNLMVYKFTTIDKENFSVNPKSIGIYVNFLKKSSSYGNKFKYFFIYENDLDKKGVLNTSELLNPNHQNVSASVVNLNYDEYYISMVANNNSICGIGIYSEVPFVLNNVCIEDFSVGFDTSSICKKYYYSTNNVILEDFNNKFDFSVVNSYIENIQSNYVPFYDVKFEQVFEYGNVEEQLAVKMNIGEEPLTIKRNAKLNSTMLFVTAFNKPYEVVEFTENAENVKAMVLRYKKDDKGYSRFAFSKENKKDDIDAYPCDLGLILDWPQENWRFEDFELYSWDQFPQMLMFDFANHTIQDEYFSRLAFFVEKTGYIGTLVSDEFIKENHGYNAHDYKASDLANFFNTVKKQRFKLNERELRLLKILLKYGIIIKNDNGYYSAGEGGIISISRQSANTIRQVLVAHECWHGIYFVDENFRNFVKEQYDSFDSLSLQFLKLFWTESPNLRYNVNDEYLMNNEFMAYMIQQKLNKCIKYFTDISSRDVVTKVNPELCEYVTATKAKYFYETANEFNNYLFENYGYENGRVYLISRE